MIKKKEIHSLPAEEVSEHTLSSDCPCNPRVLEDGDAAVAYSHNPLHEETKDEYTIVIK